MGSVDGQAVSSVWLAGWWRAGGRAEARHGHGLDGDGEARVQRAMARKGINGKGNK